MKSFIKSAVFSAALLVSGAFQVASAQPALGGLGFLEGLQGGGLSLPDLGGLSAGVGGESSLTAGSGLSLPSFDDPGAEGVAAVASNFGTTLDVSMAMGSMLVEQMAPVTALASAAPLPFDVGQFLDFERKRFDASMISGFYKLLLIQAASAQSRFLQVPSLPEGGAAPELGADSLVDVSRSRFDASMVSGASGLLESQLQ